MEALPLLLTWPAQIFVSAGLLVIFAIAVTNAYTFPRLQPSLPASTFNDYSQFPAVAVLIPARDEAEVIAATVVSLLAQDYPGLQLLVLDDHSGDGTTAVAQAVAGNDPRFRLLQGLPLPPGWMGTNWACHQLAQATALRAQGSAAAPGQSPLAASATNDILLFADADVFWQPGAVTALVAEMQRSAADLLTVWPTQVTVTWGERLTVPLMALAVLGYLPLRLAHDFYHPLAAAANGQCMAFRREAYVAIGGHAHVRGAVVEDVRLAQRIKSFGFKLRMADGNQLLRCRMYDGWCAVLDGYAKNILAGHGNHVSLLLLSTLFHWAIFIWPWLWLVAGASWFDATQLHAGWPLWPALLVALGIGARAVTAATTHQRVGDALLMPLSVALMTWVAARAIWWRWRFGGVVWKGRILRDA
jgi:chlorobactene glucosyltransferase